MMIQTRAAQSGARRAGLDSGRAVVAVVALRIATSFAWLQSALVGKDAKFSPDFLSGAGLAQRVSTTFVHTALTPGIASLLRAVVLPSAHFFAVAIAVGDLAIGLSLALGLFTRVGGVLAILRAAVNIAVAGGAGADTVGYNAMLILAGGIAVALGAGRTYGIDAMLLRRFAHSKVLRIFA